MPFVPSSDALKRILVLDLSRIRAGPTCVRQLADFGADVIKVELPGALEEDGALGAGRTTPDFQNLQRNKRSLTLNLKDPEGLKLFLRLVAKADVVVENYRPDVKARLGIDYASLAKVNPRIVLASISGFGQDGPYVGRPGVDQIAQGMGGLMSITGEAGRGPMRVGIPVADLTAGLFACIGILTALYEREASGRGQWVQTSLLQSMIFMLDFQAARWLVKGEVAGQAGNNHPTMIPTGVFQTADGYINIACAGQALWERLARAIGLEALIAHADYKKPADRLKNRDALNAQIEAKTRARTNAAWIALLTDAGVPCGEIYTIDKMFADPQVKHLGIAQKVEESKDGLTLVGQPIVLSRTPAALKHMPPERGEHTDEILGELGLSAAEIAALRARTVV